MTFIETYRHDITIDDPMFIKKIIPILKDEMDKDGTFALKFITGNTYGYLFDMYQKCFYGLYVKLVFLHDSLNQLLTLEPNNLLAQEQKYTLLYNDFVKYIYKIPNGVLFYHHFADTHETHILLKELDDARFYYLAWTDYLNNKDHLDFLGFFNNIMITKMMIHSISNPKTPLSLSCL